MVHVHAHATVLFRGQAIGPLPFIPFRNQVTDDRGIGIAIRQVTHPTVTRRASSRSCYSSSIELCAMVSSSASLNNGSAASFDRSSGGRSSSNRRLRLFHCSATTRRYPRSISQRSSSSEYRACQRPWPRSNFKRSMAAETTLRSSRASPEIAPRTVASR